MVRNLLKRRLREAFRRGRSGASGLPPLDLSVGVRPGADAAPFQDLQAELWALVRKAGRRF